MAASPEAVISTITSPEAATSMAGRHERFANNGNWNWNGNRHDHDHHHHFNRFYAYPYFYGDYYAYGERLRQLQLPLPARRDDQQRLLVEPLLRLRGLSQPSLS